MEPLAREILEAAPACADLDARAADFVNTDRQVPTAADALLGAGHILAEQFSEQAELRQRLREVLQRTGVLVSSRTPGRGEGRAGCRDSRRPRPTRLPLPADVPPSADAAAEVAAEPSDDPPPAIIEPAAEPLTVAAERRRGSAVDREYRRLRKPRRRQAAVESQPCRRVCDRRARCGR